MLIEFRVANFRSIGEEQILSLIPATMQKEYPENIFSQIGHSALNAIAIYGANGSGKSNLLLAINLMNQILHTSARTSSTTKLPYDPFLLKDELRNTPTSLEITFILNGCKYRYGFIYSEERILKEWLYRKKIGREVSLFLREEEDIELSSGFNGNTKVLDAAIEATRNNALFLSTCDMLNIEEATEIFLWFKKLTIMDGIHTEGGGITTLKLWESQEYNEKIKKYLSALELGFNNIEIRTKDTTNQPGISTTTDIKELKILATHNTYTKNGKKTGETLAWNFDDRESAGTKKAFQLSGPVLWTLANGGILVIDEIEAKMHPILTLNTIRIFFNPETNPNKAQIIFATHDTNLLTYSGLRRDQIYFSEKNEWESTEIYSLSDFKYMGDTSAERPDKDKEKRYLEGRYGAIPTLTRLGLKK